MLYPAQPDPPEWTAGDDAINAIDDDRNNADVNDMRDNSAQQLDQHDIARLKREGVGGRSLVEALAASSATFAKKTAYAQEKYVKKKLRKHLVRCRARRPTPRAVCEAYFHKQPAATNYVRYDALGMLLALGNAGAEAQHVEHDGAEGRRAVLDSGDPLGGEELLEEALESAPCE